MNLKPAILAVLATFALGAQATTTDWGTHDLLEVGAAITPVGSFEDQYLFNLAGPSMAVSTAVSNNLSTVLGLTNGAVALFREAGAVDVAVGSFAFDDMTGAISYDFGTLAAGDYYYAVSGMGTGSMGGFYTISSSVSPIPEPGSVALMLAGLSVMGLLLKRSAPQR
jgi:hypothetical protein